MSDPEPERSDVDWPDTDRSESTSLVGRFASEKGQNTNVTDSHNVHIKCCGLTPVRNWRWSDRFVFALDREGLNRAR